MIHENILELRDIKKHFEVKAVSLNPFRKDLVLAVDGVNLEIREGETMGLVGESGCGKTTLGRCILRLIEPTSGQILFDGTDIMKFRPKDMVKLREKMQIIFQDPFTSLDPRMKVEDIISEPFTVFRVPDGKNKSEKVSELLEAVGLEEDSKRRFPHEFSGGQRQRIAIARSLALNPKFLVADEPVSSLDVSVRAQILNLMKSLKRRFNLTYLYISHDLSTVRFISDSVAVMYLGKIVEVGPTSSILGAPKHPYTQALIASIPIPNPYARRDRYMVKGEPPSPIRPPSGCHFHPRCPYAMNICKSLAPELVEVGKKHYVACHLYESISSDQ